MADELLYLGALDLLDAYRAGRLSPVEIVDAALDRIDALEPALNAFMLVDGDGVRASAAASAERWARGAPTGPLDGVPVTIKDIVATKGWPTYSGSATVEAGDQAWDQDAPAVARLREAGAVILGKTTTPEFGWKGMTDGPLFGTTRNPWNPDHTPGGSSGGAGAALAAGIGALAFGTDGGGSIRIPASYCGLYGLKPNFGRVPHAPQDNPFATVVSGGPLARSVADAALMLNQLARPDARDWLALPAEATDYRQALSGGVAGLKLGVSYDLGGAEPDDKVATAVKAAVAVFADLGARVETVGPIFPPLEPFFSDYWKAGFAHLLRQVLSERHARMDPGLRRLAEEGLAVDLPAYGAAMAARAELGATMNRFHRDHDLLLTPTMPTLPPPADTTYHSPAFDRWRHAVPYTVPFNLTGQPAASIPCGVVDGLPVGLQIVGPRFGEAQVLRASAAFEAAAPFPYPHPDLAASLARISR